MAGPLIPLVICALLCLSVTNGEEPARHSVSSRGSYYEISALALDWFGANYDCRQNGMNLISLETQDEDEFMAGYLNSNYPEQKFWTSGNDFYVEGTFYWGSTTEKLEYYTNWADGEPTGNTTQNCVLFDGKNNDFKWNDAICQNEFKYVCERPL